MSEQPEKPSDGMKPKELVIGIVVGLIVNGLYDVIKALLAGGIPDFRVDLDVKPLAMLLSPIGGFFAGGFVAGIVESKEKPIELGSQTSWILIAIGTVVSYFVLRYFL